MTLPSSTMVGRKMMFDIYIRYCKKKPLTLVQFALLHPFYFEKLPCKYPRLINQSG